MSPRVNTLIGVIGVLMLAGAATAVGAQLSDVVLHVIAQCPNRGVGELIIYQDDPWGQWEGDTYTWMALSDCPITDPGSGECLGVFQAGALISYTVPSDFVRSGPQVNLGFAMQAGDALTTFTVKSGEVTFDWIAQPAGRASASFTLTDGIDEDGATLAGIGGHEAYLAQYNGFVPDGTTFTELIAGLAAPPEGVVTLAEDYPGGGLYEDIGEPVNRMSSMISFTITPRDLASGTSNYQIVPEPTALLVLAAGAALLRRR